MCIYLYWKGTNGAGTNGVTANFMFFDRGTFWVLTSVDLVSVDPTCPQPRMILNHIVFQFISLD